jgi:hypothetical protein
MFCTWRRDIEMDLGRHIDHIASQELSEPLAQISSDLLPVSFIYDLVL